jgi:hypothetical protein
VGYHSYLFSSSILSLMHATKNFSSARTSFARTSGRLQIEN